MIQKLTGWITPQRLQGNLNVVPTEVGGASLQAKTVWPSHSEQTIKPDDDYDGLALVVAKPVPRLPACVVSVAEAIAKVVESAVNIAVGTSVTAEKYYSHMLYNGVRLPRIPIDVLAQYPYAWIRDNTASGYYDLLMSSSPWWCSTNTSSAVTISTENYTQGIQWYRVQKSAAASAIAWTFNQVWNTSGGFGAESNRPVFWSNHDIPNGSATSPNIYFYGSEPVPTD